MAVGAVPLPIGNAYEPWREDMCYDPLVSFSFRQTQDLGQKTLASGWGSCRAPRSLVKEQIHFLETDPVQSPVEGTGRIWEAGRGLIRIHNPKRFLQGEVLIPS